jgi:hypothetical protein
MIPPKHQSAKRSTGLTAKLRGLQIGQSVEIPLDWENRVHTPANRLGIRVATRRLGSVNTVTVYRTA